MVVNDGYSAVERFLWPTMICRTARTSMSTDISRPTSSGLLCITISFELFLNQAEFIITPSLVVKLSTTTTPDLIGLGPLA